MAFFSSNSTPSYVDPSEERRRQEALRRNAQLEEKSKGVLDIGRHCTLASCGQTDFLPMICDKCNHVYCAEHHRYDAHSCDFAIENQNVMPKCPLCNKYVRVPLNATPDITMERHIESGCTSHLLDNKEDRLRIKQELKCDASNCVNPHKYSTIKCPKCKLQFCLSHRFPTDHACSSLAPAVKSPPQTKRTESEQKTSSSGASEDSSASSGSLVDRIRAAVARRLNLSSSSTSSSVPSSSTTSSTTSTTGLSKSQEARARVEAARLAAKVAREQSGGNPTAIRRNTATAGLLTTSETKESTPIQSTSSPATTAAMTAQASQVAAMNLIAPPVQTRTCLTGGELSKLRRTAEPAHHSSDTDIELELSQRIHFQIVFPAKDGSDRPLPLPLRNHQPQKLYFNRRITVGKAIDLICTKYGIPNYNADPKKPKITLARIDEPVLALPYSATFDKLIESGIDVADGEMLGVVWVPSS